MKEKSETSFEWLKKYNDNFVVIFKNVVEEHQSLLQTFSNDDEVFLNHTSQKLFDLPVVWAQSTSYLNQEDGDTLTALAAIRDNSKLDLVKEEHEYNAHLFSLNELDTLDLSDEVWQNTNYIETICKAELQYHQSLLPKFKTPDNQSSKDYLYQTLQQNLKKLNLSRWQSVRCVIMAKNMQGKSIRR